MSYDSTYAIRRPDAMRPGGKTARGSGSCCSNLGGWCPSVHRIGEPARRCWQQIELSGFVAQGLSGCSLESSVVGPVGLWARGARVWAGGGQRASVVHGLSRGHRPPPRTAAPSASHPTPGLPLSGPVPTGPAGARQHPAVESAINNLEHRGLDRVRSHGADGFAHTVALSILAVNLHRIGVLVRRRMREAERRRRRRAA